MPCVCWAAERKYWGHDHTDQCHPVHASFLSVDTEGRHGVWRTRWPLVCEAAEVSDRADDQVLWIPYRADDQVLWIPLYWSVLTDGIFSKVASLSADNGDLRAPAWWKENKVILMKLRENFLHIDGHLFGESTGHVDLPHRMPMHAAYVECV